MGPVVLFWTMLVVLVALAAAGARWVPAPLSLAAWIGLAVGAGQAGWVPAVTVLAFVAAASARERWGARLAGWKFDAMQVVFVALTLIAAATLLEAVHNGLLGRPSMMIAGNGSTDLDLRWYQDRTDELTPAAGFVSAPLWLWRVAMLAWSLWLALAVVRLAGWVWRAFSAGGRWQRLQWPARKAPAQKAAPVEGPVTG
jgi:hypothetical protein